MTAPVFRVASVLLVVCLINGCGHAPGTSPPPTVAVSTIQPVKRTFTDSIPAIGSAIGNPHRARQVSLAHGGEVIAVMVSDGQAVEAGQPLMKVATAPATRKAFKQAQSALAVARGGLARTRQLATQHLATRAQVDAARKAVSDAKAALQAQRQLGGGQAIDTASAPGSGVITAIQVTRGQRIPANTTLATFIPTSGLIAQLGVQPDQATRIAPGMPVTLHAVYGSSSTTGGTVIVAGHAVDPTTQLVPVQVALPPRWAAQLIAGIALSARIQTGAFRAWAVPRNALGSDAHGSYIFQVEHGKATRVDVKVLAPDGSPVGIAGALEPDAPVITLGSHEVSDGQAVRIDHSGASPAHGATAR